MRRLSNLMRPSMKPYIPTATQRGRTPSHAASSNLVVHSPISRMPNCRGTFRSTKSPALDWITADAKYGSTYNWTRGIETTTGQSLGNNIANRRDITTNGRFNMENLYNKVPFLKRVNRKFSQSNTRNTKPEKKFYEKEIVLRADTTFIVPHNQGSKKLRVVAIRKDGSRYAIKYKVLDINRIEVHLTTVQTLSRLPWQLASV